MSIDPDSFKNSRVLVVGDVMVDEYTWGEVERISPEAPVPVVSVVSETATLGGAGNVAANLAALGAKVSVAAVSGTGPAGRVLKRLYADIGVDTSGLFSDETRPTTRKTRVIAVNQQVVRIDRETKRQITGDQEAEIAGFVEGRLKDTDVVLISDYGKGLLTPGLLGRVIGACSKAGKMVIVDPKGRDYERYRGAFAITPNRREAALATGVEISDRPSLEKAGKRLLEDVGAQWVLVTCGKDGMAAFSNHEQPVFISAEARQVFDVSGAGDTVLAVLGLGLATGAPFSDAARLANTAGGIVVGKVGTATVSAAELAAAVKRQ